MAEVLEKLDTTACVAFLAHLARGGARPAFIHDDKPTSYAQLCESIGTDRTFLRAKGVSGAPVLFVSEFSPRNVSLLIALWLEGNVAALSVSREPERTRDLAKACGARFKISVSKETKVDIAELEAVVSPPNVSRLTALGQAGFVVFSSGTTGPAKGVVHRLAPFLNRHCDDHEVGTMLAFMSFDHIGGLATLFQVLSTHGTLAIPKERSPQELGRCVDLFGVNTLHVSPTLLNLVLLSGALEGRRVDSLRHIYFGSEPISPVVLERVHARLPQVRLTQLYGMSETGVLPCVNKPGDSMWLVVEGDGYSVEVIDGLCHIHSRTLMVGYLSDADALPHNVPFNSGDLGEAKDGYFRVNGRKVHLINVGGTNVSPVDVEQVIETCDNISDVVVTAAPNPILGEVVAARIVLERPEALAELKQRLYREIKRMLTPEQIPRVIIISDEPLYSKRFKKMR